MTLTQARALGVLLMFGSAITTGVAIIAAPVWFLAGMAALAGAVYGASLYNEVDL